MLRSIRILTDARSAWANAIDGKISFNGKQVIPSLPQWGSERTEFCYACLAGVYHLSQYGKLIDKSIAIGKIELFLNIVRLGNDTLNRFAYLQNDELALELLPFLPEEENRPSFYAFHRHGNPEENLYVLNYIDQILKNYSATQVPVVEKAKQKQTVSISA